VDNISEKQNLVNVDVRMQSKNMTDDVPIIDGMEIVVNSNVGKSLEEIGKESKNMEVESDNKSMELEEIITGKMRGNSICRTISKRRSSSRS